MENKEQITRDLVEQWLGSDINRSDVIDILYELAVGEYDLEQFKKSLTLDKYVHACFISPSGDGLKVLIKIHAKIETHANTDG